MYFTKCRICGCSLDPGEGNTCDECMDEQYMRDKREEALKCIILSTDFKQMELEELIK